MKNNNDLKKRLQNAGIAFAFGMLSSGAVIALSTAMNQAKASPYTTEFPNFEWKAGGYAGTMTFDAKGNPIKDSLWLYTDKLYAEASNNKKKAEEPSRAYDDGVWEMYCAGQSPSSVSKWRFNLCHSMSPDFKKGGE